jgi:WD40 repeat protein
LWDVVFVGQDEDRVATCSEDGTIKVWDLKRVGTCIMTLRGHSSDIWCLSLANFPSQSDDFTFLTGNDTLDPFKIVQSDRDNLILFSGGNDGSVKAWPLSSHCIASPEDTSSTLKSLVIPHHLDSLDVFTDKNVDASNRSPSVSDDAESSLKGETKLKESSVMQMPSDIKKNKVYSNTENTALTARKASNSRRSNGVSTLKLAPDGLRAVLFFSEGDIWFVDLESACTETSAVGCKSGHQGWSHLVTLDKSITNASITFHDKGNC